MGYFKLKLGYALLLIFLGLNTHKSFTQEIPEVTKLSEVNGDFQKINGVWQEKQGDLWIASDTHVERYNSNRSQIFNRFEGMPKSTGRINTIFIDSKEQVWLGAESGLLKFDPIKKRFFAIPSERPTTTSNIQQITEDNIGRIWMGASNGIWNFSGDNIKLITFFPSNQTVNELIYANDQIVFGTSMGLFTLNLKEKDYKKINFLNQKNLNVQSLLFTGDSYLIGTKEDGLFKTSANFSNIEKINRLPVSSQGVPVAGLAMDNLGYVYVATTGDGLLLLDQNLNLLSHYTQQEYNALSLSDNGLTGIFLGNQNTLWVFTETGQINSLNLKEKNFEFIRHDPNTYSSLADNYTTAIEKDTKGNLWIGNRQGISIFHPGDNSWQHIKSLSFSNPSSVPDIIRGLKADGIHMWVATYNDGIYKVNIQTLLRAHYSTDSKIKIPLQMVKAILVDSGRNIWAGGEQGNLTQISSGGEIKTFELKHIDAIAELASGDIIAAGKNGVFRISKNSREIKPVSRLLPNAKELPYFTINAISETIAGEIILATEGAGIVIYDPKRETLRVINKSKGLPSNRIQGLIVENNEIWAGTSRGLVNFELKKDPVIRIFDKDDGLLSSVFIRGSFARLEQKLAFGTFKGISVFAPQKLKSLAEAPTAVGLGAVKWRTRDNEFQTANIGPGEELSLKYNQNTLSFTFSETSAAKEKDLEFSWMLEGFNTEWSQPGSQNEVSYANLGAGDYTFLVKARTSNGNWSLVEQVALNIQSPWWFSTGAYIGYGLAAFLLLIMISMFRSRSIKNKKSVTQESEDVKLGSEQGKTSLKLALASLEDLSEEEDLKNNLRLKNISARLKVLLDPLTHLEAAPKEELNKVPKVSKISIPACIDKLVKDFSPLLKNKQLEIIVNDQWNSEFFYYDEEYFHRILSGIIASSINYSFEGGKIIINLIETSKGDLKLQIADNGAGLPWEDQEKITAYYSGNSVFEAQGNLLDLLNVKDYIDELGGSIFFESSKDQGTTFTVILSNAKQPVESALKKEIGKEDVIAAQPFNTPEPDKIIATPSKTGIKKILVAEDNDELRKFFVDALKSLGEVIEAKNGTEAFAAAAEHQPHVIIADFEMPGMNGVELSVAMNNVAALAQIPLYLMLSQEDKLNLPQTSNIRIFNFVAKPVNLNALFKTIKAELETTASQSYGNPNLSERNSQLLKGNSEEEFFAKLKEVILENLSNSAFAVEDLSADAGVNIDVLSLKIKVHRGINPQDFIIHTKLDYARLLLSKGKSDLSEVARQAGFPTKDLFFSSYKKRFGFMPGTIIEK